MLTTKRIHGILVTGGTLKELQSIHVHGALKDPINGFIGSSEENRIFLNLEKSNGLLYDFLMRLAIDEMISYKIDYQKEPDSERIFKKYEDISEAFGILRPYRKSWECISQEISRDGDISDSKVESYITSEIL